MLWAKTTIERAALVRLCERDSRLAFVSPFCEFAIERGIRPVHIIEFTVLFTLLLYQYFALGFIHFCVYNFETFRA
jgi:hypothetical protein